MKRFHCFVLTGCVFLLIAVSIFISSCQVGLGGTVDYKEPTVTITSHSSGNSVLNGTTTFSGTWEDDTGVTKITLKLSKYTGTNNEYTALDTFEISIPSAETEKKSGSWSYEFDTTKYPETDYTLDIIATDTSKQLSPTQSLAFAIDNTAPVITLDKPNSLNFNDPALFGREVKINGYIEDAHSIESLDVKVFKANADGSKGEEISLSKSSFGVSSGSLSKYIARYYSEDALKNLSTEEYKIYENYVAIYGKKDSANWNKNQNYIFEISATDKCGNVTKKVYLNDELKSLIKEILGKDIELEKSELVKILGDNYTGTELTETQVAAVKEVLEGTYDQSSLSEKYTYLVNDKVSLYGTINSRANPTYTINGCILGESTWGSVSSGGTLTFTVNSGYDGASFKPNVLNLILYPCDEDGNFIDKLDGTNVYKKIEVPQDYVKNSNNKSIKDLETTVTTGSYSFTLADMLDSEGDTLFKAGEYYKVEVTGYDLNNNDVIASYDSDDNEYEFGFQCVANNAKPEVTFANDREFVKVDGIANTIPVIISVSKAKKVVVSAYVQTKEGKYTFGGGIVTEGTKVIDSKEYALTDGVVTVNVPLNFDVTKLERGKNWTIGIRVVATNVDADNTETFYVYADDAAPEVAFKGKLLTAQQQKNNYEIGLITEADSLFAKDEEGKCTYTYTGTWSDIGGSGTDILYYSTDNGKIWSEFDSDEAPQATSKLGWTKALPVTEGGPYTLSFKAKDSVGNESSVITFTGEYFDFAAPTITIEGDKKTYRNDAAAPVFTITAEDTNALSSLDVVVKKNGMAVGSGNGYTLKNNTDDTKKFTATVETTEEAEWTIEATAKDCQNRTASIDTLSFVYDKTAPKWYEDSTNYVTVDGKKWNDGVENWYNATAMTFKGFLEEAVSGIERVNYVIQPAGTTDESSQISGSVVTSAVKDSTTLSYYEATLSGLVSGTNANTVTFTPVDKAGNSGEPKTFKIYVDNKTPKIESDVSGTNYTDGKAEVILTGTVEDDDSGFASDAVKVKISGTTTEKTVTATLDTTSEGYSKNKAKWKATIPAGALTDNKATDIYATVTDIAGMEITNKLCIYYVDTTPPVVNFKGKLDSALKNGNVVGLITEEDAPDGTFTVSGSWSDVNGSGTSKLYYKFNTDSDWKEFSASDAPTSDSLMNWTKDLAVEQGTEERTLSFKAVDKVGNESDEVTFTGIKFDFALPEVKVASGTVAEYYKEGQTPEFTVEATDTNKISALNLTVTKDTVTVAESDYNTAGINITTTTTDNKITKKIKLTEDGNWKITAQAVDFTGRKSSTETISTIFDTKKPVWKEDTSEFVPKVGGNPYTSATWYNSTSLQFIGYYTEEGSGISYIEYELYEPDSNVAKTSNKFTTSDKGDYESFETTLSGFIASNSANRVVFTPVDKAGNRGDSKEFEIHIDCSSPTLSVDSSSQGNKYAQKAEAITLTGTISDDASGFSSDSVKVKVGSSITESAVNVTVDTTSTGLSSTNAKWTAIIPTSVLSSFEENEQTVVTVSVNDAAGNTSSTTACTIIIDTIKPEISFKNRLGKAATDRTYKVGLITKSDSLNYDSEKNEFTYEISGDWTDNRGSGTKLLEYRIDNGEWQKFTEEEAPVSSGKTNWSKTFKVQETKKDESMTLAFRATDNVGLVSDVVTFTDIRFDYESPELSVDKSEIYNYYTATTGVPEFTITAEDTNSIESFDITVTKDGTAITSGYTLAKDTSSTTKQTAKITVSEEGKWSIKTTVADCQDQKSELDTIAFVYDKTVPKWTDEDATYYTTIGGKQYDSANPWYRESAMNFKGYVDETGSGIDRIEWVLKTATGSETSGEIVAAKVNDTIDKYSYTQAISGFVSGTNTVTFTPVDKAGNKGTGKAFIIKVDNTSPVIGTADVSGTIYTKADKNITISGSITDTDGSGFTAGEGNVVVNLKAGNSVTTVNATVDTTSTGLSSTNAKWTATISASNLSTDTATEITLSVKDNAGNTADQKLCTYYVDTTAPALTFKGDLLTAQSNSNKVGLITENNAALSTSANTYTVSGSWSDVNGSGTSKLYYSTDSGSTWKELELSEAPQSDSLTNWSKAINVTQSTEPISLSFYAEDMAGNKTDEVTFTGLTFDFSVPTISVTGDVEAYYKTAPTFTITAKDDNKLNADDAFTVTVEKDDSEVSSGYSLSKTVSDGDKTVTGTLTLSEEGKWSITVKAKDAAGRESTQAVNINTIVDTTAPKWLEGTESGTTYTPTVGGKDWNSASEETDNHSWFKSSSLKFAGYFTESGSGIKDINWELTAADSTKTQGTVTASDKGTYETFTTTIDGFTAGINTINFTAVDYAGNTGTAKQFTIYIDDIAPDYSLTDSTAILTNKVTTVTLTGTATDANSGIESVVVSISGINDASATAILTDGSSAAEKKWSATFDKTVLANLTDGTSYTVKVTVKDKAGNEVSTTATSISVDTTAPVVTISTPSSSVNLNGKHSISGKVTETSPKSLELYWSTTDNTTLNSDGALDTSTWTNIYTATDLSGIYNWTTSDLDFTTISNAKTASDGKATVYILPVAKDSAGNCNIYTYDGTTYTSEIGEQRITYTVDMNTDRPVIKFNEIEGASGTLRKYTNQISGTLTDDDTVTTFKVYATTDSSDTGIPATLDAWNSYTQQGKLEWTANSSVTSFTYEPTHITQDGTIYLYFFVMDSEGGSFFTSASSTLSQPYVTYKGAAVNSDNSAGIEYTTDSKQPQISSKSYYAGSDENSVNSASTDDSTEIKTTAITFGGSKKKYIKFIITASDDNGIKNVSGKLNTADLTFTKQTATGSGDSTATVVKESTWISKAVSVEGVTSGLYTAEITVTDNSDLVYPDTISVTVDNDGPDFGKINPSMTAVQVGTVSVSGFLSDKYSTVSTLKYLIGTDTVRAYDDSAIYSNAMADTTQYNAGTVEAFEFDFDDSEGSGDTDHTGYKNPKLPTTTEELKNYAGSTDTAAQIYDIPIYFVAEDELGNRTIKKDFYVHYNPYADRPTTEILYPSDGATLSGQIRLSGSAVDNESVKAVYYQIMPTSSTEITTWKDAKEWAKNLGLTVVDASSFTNISKKNFDADSNFWGIEATSTVSWYANLNDTVSLTADNEYCAQSKDSENNYRISVRAVAIDNGYTLGNWSNVVKIILNPDAPSFGGVEAATLKQFADSVTDFTEATATTSVDINGTTYLKGQWYYVTTVTHTNGITEISYKLDNGTSVSLVSKSGIQDSNTVKTWTSATSSEKGYSVWIPLVTDTGSGTKKLAISATTGNNVTGSKTEEFTYDNEAPTIGGLYHTDVNTEFNAGAVLTNNNNQLVIGGNVDDTTAGIDKVLFYFYREGTSLEKRIYDPMFNNYKEKDKSQILVGNSASSDITTEAISADSTTTIPLYGITQEVTASSDGKTFTLATENDHIRTGGLAKINGIYYRLSSVSGTTVILEKSCGVTSGTVSAFFPIAQVVDNTSAEKVKTFTSEKIEFTGATDDGDGMPESLTGTGTTKTWEASIHGDWLPDGPVTLVVIAFDKSGNASATSVTASIQNNRPRLSKVFLGTNLDGSTNSNGEATYSDNEFESYNILGVTGAYQEVYDLTTANYDQYVNGAKVESSRSAFTAKDKLAIVPEFVGGNGEIKVIFNNNDTTTVDDGKMTNSDVSTEDDKTVYTLAAKKGTLSDSTGNTTVLGDYFEFGDELGSDSESKKVSFTFWDATELTTQGLDSQYSFLRITDLKVAQTDSTAPNVVVKPFYWNSSSDNSLYDNSLNNGHIELEADWKDATGYKSTASSGEYDGDPKVSGKIVFRGTAYDDRALSGLYFKVTNSSGTDVFTLSGATTESFSDKKYYLGAMYTNGIWESKSSDIETNGWAMTIDYADSKTDETYNYFGQNGHKVHWELALDTEKITGVAASDITVTVAAIDTKNNNSTGRNASDNEADATAHKPDYRVDVVPYITGVKSGLSKQKVANSSVYDRTAKGHYPVSSAETVYVTGFNLSGGSLNDSSSTAKTAGLTAVTDATSLAWYSSMAVPSGSVYSAASIANFISGNICVKVNNISSLNNLNSNDSKGSYEGATNSIIGDYNIYSNYYNRQPNNDSNNLLTDDVVLDVWQFNSSVAKVKDSGYLVEPVMKINPKSGMIGFAFNNGPAYFSMANGQKTSFSLWQRNYARNTTTGFTIDSNGVSHGITVGLDTNPNSGHAGRMTYMNSSWGIGYTAGEGGNYNGYRTCRLDSIGLPAGTYNGVRYTSNLFVEERFSSPSLTTAVHSDDTYVYLAYYDDVNGQIRFRWGNTSNASSRNDYGYTFNQFADQTVYDVNSNSVFESKADYYSVPASSTVKYDGTNTAYAGEYVSIAVIPGSTYAEDVVVMTWYDATESCWWYSYKKNPCNDNDMSSTHSDGYWSKPIMLMDDAGEYCKIAVDANGGVHMAAYDIGNADLVYAYLPTYSSTSPKLSVVDSYSQSGTNITLDVGLTKVDSTTYAVPHIGYYSAATSKAKVASLSGVITQEYSDDIPDGTESDYFTGKWEVSTLPTTSRLRNDYINVGLWKTDGVIKKSTTGTSSQSNDTGYCYGNGTANAVLGYAIKVGTLGYVETAQMK